MDRKKALTEYGHILHDMDDWLSSGYRQEHPEFALKVSSETESPVIKKELPSDEKTAVPFIPVSSENSSSLKQIESEIAECSACNLYLTRRNPVSGIGCAGAQLMIVTPPPYDGAESGGNPLTPAESEYLGKWIKALGLDYRDDTFITPAVKCRTPGARPPQSDESAACSVFLKRQYREVSPRSVLALGAAACGALTGNPADFPSLVGREWTWGGVPALVLWTPAEVLAHPARLREPVWESLKKLKAAWNAVPGSKL